MPIKSTAAMIRLITDVNLIELPKDIAENGKLIIMEGGGHVPFVIERVFTVQASAGDIRGQHAHINCSQFMVASNGAVEIHCDDGESVKVFVLDRSEIGLLVPPGIWCQQTYLTQDAILTVLCDQHYSASDYIRDYDEFLLYKERQHAQFKKPIRLNLGCGGRPLANYTNVDMDTVDQIKQRYPDQHYATDLEVVKFDIFNLPYEDSSVQEVRADGLIENLSFIDEPRFFNEILRILEPGGTLYLSTVDFEKTARQWLEAVDDWKDFYRNDSDAIESEHWFGTNTYKPINRWGYLTTNLYGSQNGERQYHKNCYTEDKLRAICRKLGLQVESIEHFQWKGDREFMLGLSAIKLQ